MKHIKDSLLFALSILIGQMAYSQTNIKGVITTDQVWDMSGSPYTLTQNTIIDTMAEVEVRPGVVIKNNGKNELTVYGGFRAVGKKDSMISIEQVQVRYKETSQDYEPSTRAGALIKWCKVEAPALNHRAFNIEKTSMMFEDCYFEIEYYGIYKLGSTYDSSTIWVNRCDFVHTDPGNGQSIYISDGNSVIENSSFKNGRDIYVTGNIYMDKNQIDSFESVSIGIKDDIHLSCNQFTYLEEGIQFKTVGNIRSGITVKMENNTLDNVGSAVLPSYYPMVEIMDFAPAKGTKYTFNNNNFLKYSGTLGKVEIYGTNPSPSSSTSIDFKNNYWETTVAAYIDTMIVDYNDDVTIFGKVDYSGALAAKDTSCSSNQPPPCKASYYIGVDTGHIFNLFIITNSTGTTANTTYSWDFGDGKTSNKKNPSHQYATFGKYNLCLTIKDTTTGCNSTYCDSIGLDSLGNVLKIDGFTITVLNEGDVLNVPSADQDLSLTVFPNPTSGVATLQFESKTNEPFLLDVMDMSGRLLHKERGYSKVGLNQNNIDMSSYPGGLYFIKIQSGSSIKTIKILKKL